MEIDLLTPTLNHSNRNTNTAKNKRDIFNDYKSLKKLDFYIKKYIIFELTYDNQNHRRNKVKILDKYFIKKNKNKCKIIYNNKINELKEYFEDINSKYNHKDLIKFKLIFIHNIIDMSYMFYNCESLISLSAHNEINLDFLHSRMNIIDTNNTFDGCISLISLPMKSKFYTCHYEVKFEFCFKCNSLTSFPIQNKSDSYYIKKMNKKFHKCKFKLKLPDFYILNIHKFIIFELAYKFEGIYDGKLKILGKEFILKNKGKGKIIYYDCEFELKEYIEDIENNYKDIKMILCLDKNINDMSYIFHECDSLISVEYYKINNQANEINDDLNLKSSYSKNKNSNNNINNSIISSNDSNSLYKEPNTNISSISNIKNSNFFSENEDYQIYSPKILDGIKFMFYGCKLLISIPDISNWNTTNVKDMSFMFNDCKLLISLPDISKWNTSNVKDMSFMFNGCNSLISLPDISNWNTSNANDISGIFKGCNLLISLPDISKWNTSNVKDMNEIFSGCNSLISIPNISKWDTINVQNMSSMFSGCELLKSLPDISKWNTSNVLDMRSLFSGSNSLISLPNISKWNTSNVEYIDYMFTECYSLISLPDILNWNINNFENIKNMFRGCNLLISLPDISQWNISKNKNISD